MSSEVYLTKNSFYFSKYLLAIKCCTEFDDVDVFADENDHNCAQKCRNVLETPTLSRHTKHTYIKHCVPGKKGSDAYEVCFDKMSTGRMFSESLLSRNFALRNM